MFLEGEEFALGMLVMDEQANVGRGSAPHSLESVNCGADGSGDFVGAKVEPTVDCDAILED